MGSLKVWSRLCLRLGALLTAIGLVPMLVVQYLIPSFDSVLPGLLALLVAPLGLIILVIGVGLFLVELARPKRGPS